MKRAGVAVCAVMAVALAGCGAAGAAGRAPAGGSPGGAGAGHGRVDVLNAGSLESAIEGDGGLGDEFSAATPYDFRGYAAGSTKLANQIKGKIRRGDVYISADPAVNKKLRGKANGDRVRWWAPFAKSPLVIGFNPRSEFADALKSKPWYDVLTRPGIKIGRTDPKLDPKGAYTVQALQEAAKAYDRPKLAGSVLDNSRVFPETQLVARLQSGQLDAGFFYSGEVSELSIPSTDLGEVDVGATYTVTVLRGARDREGAIAFVEYLLGPKGRRTLEKHGFEPLKAKPVSGDKARVPTKLRPFLSG